MLVYDLVHRPGLGIRDNSEIKTKTKAMKLRGLTVLVHSPQDTEKKITVNEQHSHLGKQIKS